MKQRLDVLLVEQGHAASREKAKAMIMSGVVFVNGQREDKAGSTFDEKAAATIEIHGSTLRYVSRGGLKLEKAVEQFGFSLKDKICMDVGASTGGFTDCMLQNGAAKVQKRCLRSMWDEDSLIGNSGMMNVLFVWKRQICVM